VVAIIDAPGRPEAPAEEDMLRIWGRISSINVQKVVWCALELGCEFERIDAAGEFGVVDTAEYGRLNPNRKVPVIEDEGFVLWESNAIVRYLCAKHGDKELMPASLTARADCDRWMDWQATEFSTGLRDAFWQLIRVPEPARQLALVEESIRRSEAMVAILDDALADRDYLVGDSFTMADIPAGCTVHRWLGLPIERIPRPNVDKWYERIMNRPAARQVLTLPLK
jgi:glutathione S-transferase